MNNLAHNSIPPRFARALSGELHLPVDPEKTMGLGYLAVAAYEKSEIIYTDATSAIAFCRSFWVPGVNVVTGWSGVRDEQYGSSLRLHTVSLTNQHGESVHIFHSAEDETIVAGLAPNQLILPLGDQLQKTRDRLTMLTQTVLDAAAS